MKIIECNLACQTRIGGYWGPDCMFCPVNGAGKCDPDGCPKQTGIFYLETTNLCAGEIEPLYNYPRMKNFFEDTFSKELYR